MAKTKLNYIDGQIFVDDAHLEMARAINQKDPVALNAFDKIVDLHNKITSVGYDKEKNLQKDLEEFVKQTQLGNVKIPYKQMVDTSEHYTIESLIDIFDSNKNIGTSLANRQEIIKAELDIYKANTPEEFSKIKKEIEQVVFENTQRYSKGQEAIRFTLDFRNKLDNLARNNVLSDREVNLYNEYMGIEREKNHYAVGLTLLKATNNIGDNVKQGVDNVVSNYNKLLEAERAYKQKLVDWSIKGYENAKEKMNSLRESLDLTNRVKSGFMSVVNTFRKGVDKVKDFGDATVNNMVNGAKAVYDTGKDITMLSVSAVGAVGYGAYKGFEFVGEKAVAMHNFVDKKIVDADLALNAKINEKTSNLKNYLANFLLDNAAKLEQSAVKDAKIASEYEQARSELQELYKSVSANNVADNKKVDNDISKENIKIEVAEVKETAAIAETQTAEVVNQSVKQPTRARA